MQLFKSMETHDTWVIKMWLLLLVLSIWSSMTEGSQNLTASDQLVRYKKATKGYKFTLTDQNGAPVDKMDIINVQDELIDSNYFLQSITHFNRERIPPRAVHSKGTVAYGYFEVTEDISDICKAKMFSEVGKKTPMAVRFSNQVAEQGEADTTREPKGFSVKFYTEEGNFDLVAINHPVFVIKDPVLFPSAVHALKRNPQTRLHDQNSVWDFLTSRPESILFNIINFSDNGISNGFRHMSGYPIHTYQVYNDQGVVSYIRFRFAPDAGIENLSSSEGKRIAGEDPDYYARDLYEAILNGDYPSWTVFIQHMSEEDAKNADFNPFDVTLLWLREKYPHKPIGKLVLNKNVKNNFAENELISFCPGNLIPGINGAPDKMFEARRLAYLDAAHYRLGVNAYKIKVNCPMMSDVNTYFRDGKPPVNDNEGNAPNYYPNTFNGPEPIEDKVRPPLNKVYVDPAAHNYGLARDLYANQFNEAQRNRLIENLVDSLSSVTESIKNRAIKMFTRVHPDFGERMANALKNATKTPLAPKPIEGPSVQ